MRLEPQQPTTSQRRKNNGERIVWYCTLCVLVGCVIYMDAVWWGTGKLQNPQEDVPVVDQSLDSGDLDQYFKNEV